eukprot:Unigene19125_Nuclearia_a/m.54305 Unigene19125_Nuclearia_a/g.54305  ORF Unigene19125_Nuclearia_a/g.54305 Unigene19125_Nuclearia_a/m.54305 type:complete len:312 (-) Unigene19125_Nuclearia_a:603-1538(-)
MRRSSSERTVRSGTAACSASMSGENVSTSDSAAGAAESVSSVSGLCSATRLSLLLSLPASLSLSSTLLSAVAPVEVLSVSVDASGRLPTRMGASGGRAGFVCVVADAPLSPAGGCAPKRVAAVAPGQMPSGAISLIRSMICLSETSTVMPLSLITICMSGMTKSYGSVLRTQKSCRLYGCSNRSTSSAPARLRLCVVTLMLSTLTVIWSMWSSSIRSLQIDIAPSPTSTISTAAMKGRRRTTGRAICTSHRMNVSGLMMPFLRRKRMTAFEPRTTAGLTSAKPPISSISSASCTGARLSSSGVTYTPMDES